MNILHYREDLRTIVWVVIYFTLTATIWLSFDKMPLALQILSIMLLCWWSFFCAVIVHNTVHCPVFKKKVHNQIFQIVLSFTYGHAVSPFVSGHNLSHHRHLFSSKDIANTQRMTFKINFFNQLFFFFRTLPLILKTDTKWVLKMKKLYPAWYNQYVMEMLLLTVVRVILLIIDWKLTLLVIFIPHIYAQWGIIGTNYWQHDGCDANHRFNHSRNFTNKLLNFFTFNNGFHGLHHDRPDLHWSELRTVYERDFKPHLHPNLDRKFLSVYLFESCIYPGKRIDYLGNPITVSTLSNDHDWVDSTDHLTVKKHMGAIQ